jgi:hypothetical protein
MLVNDKKLLGKPLERPTASSVPAQKYTFAGYRLGVDNVTRPEPAGNAFLTGKKKGKKGY